MAGVRRASSLVSGRVAGNTPILTPRSSEMTCQEELYRSTLTILTLTGQFSMKILSNKCDSQKCVKQTLTSG